MAWAFATLGVQNGALIAGLTERKPQESLLCTFDPHNVQAMDDGRGPVENWAPPYCLALPCPARASQQLCGL